MRGELIANSVLFFPAVHLQRLGFNLLYAKRKDLKRGCTSTWVDVDTKIKHRRQIILFIGQTGSGKSTLINTLLQSNCLMTDDIECCTKEVTFVDFCLDRYRQCRLTFCDMPGIGENESVDKEYENWYKCMVCISSCIVYLVKSDNRALERDLCMLSKIAQSKNKLIFAISQVEKEEPCREWNFSQNQPGNKQLANISEKVLSLQKLFNCKSSSIIPISSKERYNIDKLIDKIESFF